MELTMTSRRSLLLGGVAAAGGAIIGTLPFVRDANALPAGSKVVFADFGGTLRDARRTSLFAPFEAETGAQIIYADVDMARFQLMAERGRSEWDVADINGSDAVRFAKAGLLETLPDSVPRSEFVPDAYKNVATGGYAINNAIAYNANELPKGKVPEAWTDFFDLAKLPGRRGMLRGFALTYLEAALIADGVPPEKLYPVDFDRAFAKLDTIRDQVLFAANVADAQQALVQGSVAMTILPSGRTYAVKQQNDAIDITWNQAFLSSWTASGVPKGAPNPEGAFALLTAIMDPKRQAHFAELSAYGPAAAGAFEFMKPEAIARLPNSPDHLKIAIAIDQEKLAEQRGEMLKRYLAWVGG